MLQNTAEILLRMIDSVMEYRPAQKQMEFRRRQIEMILGQPERFDLTEEDKEILRKELEACNKEETTE